MTNVYVQRINKLYADYQSSIETLQKQMDIHMPAEIERQQRELQSKFDADLAVIVAEADHYESVLDSDLAKSRHSQRLAANTVPSEYRASFALFKELVPALSWTQRLSWYRDACVSGDIGAQMAIESFTLQVSVSDDDKLIADELRQAQAAQVLARAAALPETKTRQYNERQLSDFVAEIVAALTPIREEKARRQ